MSSRLVSHPAAVSQHSNSSSSSSSSRGSTAHSHRKEKSAEDEDDGFGSPPWDQHALAALDAIESEYHARKKQRMHPPTHLTILLHPQPLSLHNTLAHRFAPLTPSPKNRSLYQRFREKRGFLSVSDLVSCLWCEVQVEYGLLGKRYLKPSQRPTSFISSSGVEIKVNTHKAISRQNILDGGIKVHTKLEKEVAPEKVKVQVITQVDSWGLKVMNTVTSLCLLRSTGMMREIPVWGFIGGFFIQGIVDQMDLVPEPRSSASSNDRETGDIEPSPSSPDKETFSVRISDSKTTQGESLPPPEYTESPRYQLMLYKYLYDQQASGLFNVEKFASKMGLDLDEPFSRSFMKDAKPVFASVKADEGTRIMSSSGTPTTLREMFGLYQKVVDQIGVSQSTLEIVYRKRGKPRERVSSDANALQKIEAEKLEEALKKIPKPDLAGMRPVITYTPHNRVLVDPQLLANQSHPAGSNNKQLIDPALLNPGVNAPAPSESRPASPTASRPSTALSRCTESTTPVEDLGVVEEAESSQTATSQVSDVTDLGEEELMMGMGPSVSSLASLTPVPHKGRSGSSLVGNHHNIIGAYQFHFHPLEFSRFITRTIRFWNGDVAPVGVDIRHSNKCSPCEFKESCEWRAKLANQILDSLP